MRLHPDNPFLTQLSAAIEMVELVATGKRVCATISGPPGLGKSHHVKQVLERHQTPFEVVDGTPAGLITKAYEFAQGGVILLDDADSLMIQGGIAQANLMKRLIAPEPVREIVNETKEAQRGEDLTPPRFVTRCGIIWLTNIKFDDPRAIANDRRPHFDALKSRGIRPIELTSEPHWILDYLLHLITEQDLLRNMGLARNAAQDVVGFVCANAWHLDELSVRCVKEIAQLRRDLPNTWKNGMTRFLVPTARSKAPVPRPPRIITPTERKQGISEPSVIQPPNHVGSEPPTGVN